VFSVIHINKCHFASLITAGENGDMEVYRELLNNVARVYIANNACCSSGDSFRFHSLYGRIFSVAELWLLCGYSAL
jgi:hypothetical protein